MKQEFGKWEPEVIGWIGFGPICYPVYRDTRVGYDDNMETENIQLHDTVRIIGYNEFYNWVGPVQDITWISDGDRGEVEMYGVKFNEYDDDYWYFTASELVVEK